MTALTKKRGQYAGPIEAPAKRCGRPAKSTTITTKQAKKF